MSSQERWDVVLRVLCGPLELEGDIVCRGPVVRMGARPGPGGLNLKDYRGLDDRQAVISAYDGATVSLAPVGTNQVRMAPHPNVDWNELQPLRNPAYLTDGCAFHLGPPGRGDSRRWLAALDPRIKESCREQASALLRITPKGRELGWDR